MLGGVVLLGENVIGENVIGEAGEKVLTLLGSLFVVTGHWFNFRLCGKKRGAECLSL
jgi:hypothetical protein